MSADSRSIEGSAATPAPALAIGGPTSEASLGSIPLAALMRAYETTDTQADCDLELNDADFEGATS